MPNMRNLCAPINQLIWLRRKVPKAWGACSIMRKPDMTLSLACSVTGVLNCEAVTGKLKQKILNPGVEFIMLI